MTHTYYSPKDLYVEGTLVVLRIGGEECCGFAKFTAAGNPKWRVGTLRECKDVPSKCVEAWRPVDLAKWKDPLPEPMKLLTPPNWQSQPEPHSEPESAIGEDWWVNPRTRLGTAGEPPVSPLECEIRILRAICTQEEQDRDPIRVESCWPKDLLISSKVVQKNLRASRSGRLPGLRQEDYDDIHVDASELDARIARWDSLPRDVSDVESWPRGMGPKYWPDPDDEYLFVLRAQRNSTSSIARAMRIPEAEIVEMYAHARKTAFERANKSEGEN